jgi:1,2-diacylglycerol 3-alpha-glucosyltransferase
LIHSFWLGECASVGEELAKKYAIPHLNTLMGQDVRVSNRFLRKKSLDAISEIALCDRHAREFEKNAGKKPAAIIPWGIEEEKIELSAERNIDIFAAGSLIELKRYEWLIRAVAEIKKDFPSVKVMVAGDGPLKSDLEKLADSLGVHGNIDFAGQISREKVLSFMQQSKILVHPSSFESYGFVFAEARKFGMAIVSSAVGIAKAGENWKVAENLNEMVAAIKYFLVNKKEFSGEIIHSSVETAERYEVLYKQMMKVKS